MVLMVMVVFVGAIVSNLFNNELDWNEKVKVINVRCEGGVFLLETTLIYWET